MVIINTKEHTKKETTDVTPFYPSADGNAANRANFLSNIQTLLEGVDTLKDPNKLTLGTTNLQDQTQDYYNRLTQSAHLPEQGYDIEKTIQELLKITQGQRYVNSNYIANAAPLPTTASILGSLLMTLTNGNNVWDVEGSAGANAEVQITSILSSIVGYNPNLSTGYTTWGGQGAVFNSLRLAIAKRFPQSNQEGLPSNLYVFCNELAHYSLYKSCEATGIGTNHLIKVKANKTGQMDIHDLHEKLEKVIEQGGIPLYILATMGTTDSFAIDDLYRIKQTTQEVERSRHLETPIYIHADTAMGGMYAFFNHYDFNLNPLNIPSPTLQVLRDEYQAKFQHLHLADSMVFDFHKLGQTPYATSLFLLKDRTNLKYVDLDPEETPYLGNQGFGSYHSSYTLECSRAGSAIPILASLLNLGVEGYQQLLANYLILNHQFRKQLKEQFPTVAITNHLSPVTTFRFYPTNYLASSQPWLQEQQGELTAEEITTINQFNDEFATQLGVHRDELYFGSTRKQQLIPAIDSAHRLPLYTHKFFAISPYTSEKDIPRYIAFLQKHLSELTGLND